MTTCGWTPTRIGQPSADLMPLADLKVHCQIDPDQTEHDAWLMSRLRAAVNISQDYCRTAWVEQQIRLVGEEFPSGWRGAIALPIGPVISVQSVNYRNAAGELVTLENDLDYVLILGTNPEKISHGYSTWWPSNASCFPGSVTVDYLAGYPSAGSPAGADQVPDEIKEACAMLVADWFNNREDSISGTIIGRVPNGFYEALQMHRRYP